MKVLIQQVLLGEGHLSFRSDDYDRRFLLDVAIPSVKRYAEKFNYDYSLDNEIQSLINDLPVLPERENVGHSNMRLTFQKFLNLYKDYDYILLLDCDCFILNDAPELPLHPGISVTTISHHRIKNNLLHLNNRKILSNAGFYLFDRPSAVITYNYMTNKIIKFIENKDRGFHDEIELANMLDSESDIPVNILGDNWNYSPWLGQENVPKKFVYHFSGDCKYSRYKSLIENGYFDSFGNYVNSAGMERENRYEVEIHGDIELVKKSKDQGGILKLRNKS